MKKILPFSFFHNIKRNFKKLSINYFTALIFDLELVLFFGAFLTVISPSYLHYPFRTSSVAQQEHSVKEGEEQAGGWQGWAARKLTASTLMRTASSSSYSLGLLPLNTLFHFPAARKKQCGTFLPLWGG